MAPRTKRGADTSQPEDVGKLLLRLKLRLAALQSGGPSAAAVRECLKAAEILESSLATLEQGLSALPLALSQGSASEAKKSIEKAKQLSADAGSFLIALTRFEDMDEEIQWPLLRPVMRLLLWLIPEHLPVPVTVKALTVQPPGQGTAAGGRGRQNTSLLKQPDGGWREEATTTFAREVATAPLARVVLGMAIRTVRGDSSIPNNTWHQGIQGSRVLEECLIWLTLIARLHIIASAMADAERLEAVLSTSSRLDAELVPFPEYLLSELPNQAGPLNVLGKPVIFWIHGHFQPNTSLPERGVLPQNTISTPEQRSFLARFEPSKELANAAGLWRPPAVILQHLMLLFSTVPIHGLSSSPLSMRACLERCKCHWTALTLLKPGECLPLQGHALQDYVRRLPSLVDMHLRALTLMFRLALGSNSSIDLREICHATLSSTSNCIFKTIAPMLSQDQSLLCGAAPYLPPGMATAADGTFPLSALCQYCDANLLGIQQHQLRQQQQRGGLGRNEAEQLGEHSQQEVTELCTPALLQRAALSPQHSGEMQQQQPGGPKQMLFCLGPPGPKQTGHTVDQHVDILDCATAAGELMRLGLDALNAHPGSGDREVNILVAQALLLLLQLLRPPAYSASTLSSRQGRAWVLCFSNISQQLSFLVGTDDAQEPGPLWNAIGLRVLLEQTMPVLQHAAGPDHMTSHDHVPVSNEDRDSETDPPPAPDGYCTLLLGAAAQLLTACIPAASTSHAAHLILSKGLQHAGGTQQGQPAGSTAIPHDGGDDLQTAVHAAQTLAAELVSGGAWWQEAKAHYPLPLIDTLHFLIKFLPAILPGPGDMTGYAANWRWSCTRCATQCSEGGIAEGHASSRPSSCSLLQPQEEVAKQGASSQHAAANLAPPKEGAQTGAPEGNGQPSGSPLCSSAAAGNHSGGSGTHTIGFSTCGGSFNSTSLLFGLVARLWELLSDRSIVGQAPRPAAWMPASDWYATHSAEVLVEVLKALDSRVKDVIDQLAAPGIAVHNQPEQCGSSSSSSSDAQASCAGESSCNTSGVGQHGRAGCGPSSTGQGSSVNPNSAPQLVAQLASLVPHVSMDAIESSARACPAWGSGDFSTAMSTLRLVLGVEPALRVVCMLALAGHLDAQQRLAVVALLGGRGSSNSANSSTTSSELGNGSAAPSAGFLPIPEPPGLAAARQEGDITLQDLAISVLGTSQAAAPAGKGLGERCSPPVVAHVLLAFGADQLPGLAMVHGAHSGPVGSESSGQQQEQEQRSPGPTITQSLQEEEEVMRQCQELQARARRASELLGNELVALYQSWLRSSLLKICCDTLNKQT